MYIIDFLDQYDVFLIYRQWNRYSTWNDLQRSLKVIVPWIVWTFYHISKKYAILIL